MASRAQATKPVKEPADYHRAIVETAPESLLVLDRDLRVKAANRSFYQTFLVSPQETENRLLSEVHKGEWNIPGLRSLLEGAFENGAGFEDFEVVREFPGAGPRTLLLSARFIRPEPDKLILLAIEDGTERLWAQEALRSLLRQAQENVRLYADVVKNMQVGSSIWHLENPDDAGSFKLVDSNPAAARASGAPLEKFHGKTMAESFPRILKTEIPTVLREVLLSGEARDLGEVRYADEYGPAGIFSAKVFPLANHHVGAAFENITQRRQAEDALHLLVQVTAAANEAEDLPAMTSRCLEQFCKLRGWQVGQAWIVDSAANVLVCMPDSFYAEMDVAEFRNASLEMRIPRGFGLPGRVWHTLAPAWISDAMKDSNFERAKFALGAGLRGGFAFPIQSGERLFAIFEFFSADIRTPDPHFLSAVAKLGTHLGIVYERKRAEELLRREKEFTERLINSTVDGILAFDRQCRYTVWNPGMERVFGVGKEKTIGRCAFEVFPFLKETGEDKFFLDTLAGNSVVAKDRPYRVREMGREGFYEAYYSPIRDACGGAEGAGAIIGGLAIIHDITERERAEQALQESEERYRELFENANDLIYIADLQGNIIDLNKAAERITGYSRAEALGMNLAHIIAPDQMGRAAEMLGYKLAAGGQTTYEVDIIAKHGRRVALETSTRLIVSDGRPVAVQGMARDITERKRSEKSLRELSARLIHAQDEERRRIARELHDSTAQTLSALAVNLALLKQQVDGLGGRAPHLLSESEALVDEASREIRTVAQLLHPPQLEESGLAAAVRGYATSFAERSGVSLDLDVPLSLTARLPQEVQTAIFRILQESLTNIHRHSGSPTASVRLALDDSEVTLEVRDQGRGMPSEILDTSGSIASLGVGVAGMRERVRQLGGRLEIVSGSVGTSVKAILPVSEGQA